MVILIVVESPGKIDKISSILGSNYKVVASYGHIRDLDPKSLSIDVGNNYEPHYIIPPDKSKVVQNLRYHADKCDEVIIASDLDREGEMIGFSIMEVLKLKDPKRIVFNEITSKAIKAAVENPGKISNDMVMAQQTRRLLDRLVGYKISPLLSKQIQGNLSAGRVQSVVVKIIIDLENEISTYQSNSYFKTHAIFDYNESVKINCILTKGKEIYKVNNKDKCINLLNEINKKTKHIISKVSESISKKTPPPPHITSSLMQEASTRFNMNSKRTMDIAQKLYEAGHITYMRTDSTLLSVDAINDCNKYILKTFGESYYTYRLFKTKSKDAMEAHEAIRPTKIEHVDIDMDEDCKKLYSIIWKRTLASLMTDAKINTMTIQIDCMNNDISIFKKIFEEDNIYFTCNIDTTIFDGYMILYTMMKNIEESDSDIISNTITNTIKLAPGNHNIMIQMDNINVNEEYSKPPLRYNEAGLIKYMKTNGIGRPSTYASIISKIIERKYVEIKNIDGVMKDVIILSITNKTLGKIKETSKTISIGKEKMKIIPTEIGIKVNDFMIKNFMSIMDIKFTSNMEKMLDKVATGKAIWYNVLDIYYKLFSPMVEILEKESINTFQMKKDDTIIGIHPITNQNIYLVKAKYGMCLKVMQGDKYIFKSIDGIDLKSLTLDIALKLLEYPKDLGKIGSTSVSLCKGSYGLYLKAGAKIVGIKDKIEEHMITLDYAKKLIDGVHDSNVFNIKNKIISVKNGQYGYYLMVMNGTKKPTNIPIPKKIDISTINVTIINEIIKNNNLYKKKQKNII